MEYAHKVSKVIIGKKYLAAHAIIKIALDGTVLKIPINPIKHNDPQFGVKADHYHIDGRFSYKGFLKYGFAIKNGITNNIIFANGEGMPLIYFAYEFKGIEYLESKCIRKNTGINPVESVNYKNWYQTMIGKSCAGKKCPHFGTIMLENQGKLFCPLHNLVGDSQTFKIVEPY